MPLDSETSNISEETLVKSDSTDHHFAGNCVSDAVSATSIAPQSSAATRKGKTVSTLLELAVVAGMCTDPQQHQTSAPFIAAQDHDSFEKFAQKPTFFECARNTAAPALRIREPLLQEDTGHPVDLNPSDEEMRIDEQQLSDDRVHSVESSVKKANPSNRTENAATPAQKEKERPAEDLITTPGKGMSTSMPFPVAPEPGSFEKFAKKQQMENCASYAINAITSKGAGETRKEEIGSAVSEAAGAGMRTEPQQHSINAPNLVAPNHGPFVRLAKKSGLSESARTTAAPALGIHEAVVQENTGHPLDLNPSDEDPSDEEMCIDEQHLLDDGVHPVEASVNKASPSDRTENPASVSDASPSDRTENPGTPTQKGKESAAVDQVTPSEVICVDDLPGSENPAAPARKGKERAAAGNQVTPSDVICVDDLPQSVKPVKASAKFVSHPAGAKNAAAPTRKRKRNEDK
ncbi:hypothetical protein HDU96_003136, partial [Phlyctochytrium bullatum]